jgi:endonuclease-3
VPSRKRLSNSEIGDVFRILGEMWPDAHCELDHNNGFQLLIAVVLSAQTTDKAVNKALAPVLQNNPNFSAHDLVALGESGFLKIIKSIGLAPTKAKNSVALAHQLIRLHNGEVPLERGALEALPGVGRKTANVVLNVLAGLPTMAVDTHVARVSVRMGLVNPTENRLKIEEELLKAVPAEWGRLAHHLLIFHGRYFCTARAPKCSECKLASLCKKVGIKQNKLNREKIKR